MTQEICFRKRWKTLIAKTVLFVVLMVLMAMPANISAQQKQGGSAGQLKVVVTGMESDAGQVRIALFNSEESYKSRNNPFRTASVKIRNKRTECSFEDLPCGTYAIRLYHDVNENGKLDRDAGGMPSEPYAFSNNAKGMMGPAPWAAAKFLIKSIKGVMEISLD